MLDFVCTLPYASMSTKSIKPVLGLYFTLKLGSDKLLWVKLYVLSSRNYKPSPIRIKVFYSTKVYCNKV